MVLRKNSFYGIFIISMILFMYFIFCVVPTYANSPITSNNIVEVNAHTFSNNTYAYSKLDISPNGKVYLAHVINDGTDIVIKKWNGTNWETITSVRNSDANVTYINGPLDITVDSNNGIHLAYHLDIGTGVTSTRGIGYGYYNGSSWNFTQIEVASDPNGWKDYRTPIIEVDSDGKVYLVYEHIDGNGTRKSEVRFATNVSGTWSKQGVYTKTGSSDGNLFASIAIDSNKKIHISYTDNNAFYYTFKSASDSNFSIASKLVDGGSLNSIFSSIFIDSSDNLYFTYFKENGYSYIETNKSGNWQTEQVYFDQNRSTYPVNIFVYGSSVYLLMDSWKNDGTDEYLFAMVKNNNQWISGKNVLPADNSSTTSELDFIINSDGSYMIIMLDESLRKISSLSGTKTAFGLVSNIPQAPNVSADDINNTILGIDMIMEYQIDGGAWTAYTGSMPDLSGNKTVKVRIQADSTSGTPAGEEATLTFTTNPSAPPAPNVSADDINNTILGIDMTMEYQIVGGAWTAYTGSMPDLSGNKTVKVRIQADSTSGTPAGEEATLTFTTNPSAPPAPNVSADDINNTILGIDMTMEYQIDGGVWTAYTGSMPNLSGNKTVKVRVQADSTSGTPAGEEATLTFTTNPIAPAAPNVSADDINNTILGIDMTMEYQIDGGVWTAYTGSMPDLSGNKTVKVRIHADSTSGTPAGKEATLTFTTNPIAPAAPNVSADDINNTIIGMDATMEYQIDGEVWTAYTGSMPDLSGNKTVKVRIQADSTSGTPAGEEATLTFTTNQSAPPAPNVSADDVNNTIIGMDATMEYQIDFGAWTAYTGSMPDLSGNKTVKVRIQADSTSGTPAGEEATLTFTTNQSAPPAPNVSADDVNNTIIGMDATMEYQIDGGAWTAYTGSMPNLSGNKTVKVRIQADSTSGTPAGEEATLTFTTNQSAPPAPYVSADDVNNTIIGMDATMEYQIDGGAWTAYTGSMPDLSGNKTVKVRIQADSTSGTPAGEEATLTFTTNQSAPPAPNVSADDVNNTIIGMDATMEYQIDGGAWTAYTGSMPDLSGNKTVKVRIQADSTSGTPAGEEATLTFTTNQSAPLAPNVSVDDVNNTIIGIDMTMEYQIDSGVWTEYLGSMPDLSGDITVKVRVKSDTNTGTPAGAVTTLTFTTNPSPNLDQVAPTSLQGFAPTFAGNDGQIKGASPEMEYKLKNDSTWIQVTGTTIIGLVAGTYEVRYKAKSGYNAGQITEVVIPQYVAPSPNPNDNDESRGSTPSHGGGNNIGGSSTTPSVNIRPADVGVSDGSKTESAAKVEIVRQTENNKKVDQVVLDNKTTEDTLKKALEQKKDTVNISISDLPNDLADEVFVKLPNQSIGQLSGSNVSLNIQTEDVSIQLPKESVQGLNRKADDLFFRVIPIRKEEEKKEVISNTLNASVVKEVAGDNDVQVLGKPMTIETNYQNQKTLVTFSLKDITLPTDTTEREMFLNSLAVFIQHSDGEKVVNKGKVKYDANGKPLGIEIEITKFSTFTIISVTDKTGTKTHAPYIQGFGKQFKPAEIVTRKQMAAMLARNLPEQTVNEDTKGYTDINKNNWAYTDIMKAKNAGIMLGATETKFNPDGAVTRAQMAVIAYRWIQKECSKDSNAYSSCSSLNKIADADYKDVLSEYWAQEAISFMKIANIMTGFEGNTFKPEDKLTRAQAVKVLNRLFKRGPLNEVETSTFTDVPTSHWAYKEIEEAARAHSYTLEANGEEVFIDK
ncbi:S-layer homology domain-containing protein [Bacillus sp. CGMCC 1.16607]|uniref:S-layer homology domain-containing protein n=1 Tax=Bacillus sp. CGMCC 1.16607 TaxID=3351842 RepID=UPI003627F564